MIERGKLLIGQQVRVIDQRPHVYGVISEISNWNVVVAEFFGDVIGDLVGKSLCYRVICDNWDPKERWIDPTFLEELESGQ